MNEEEKREMEKLFAKMVMTRKNINLVKNYANYNDKLMKMIMKYCPDYALEIYEEIIKMKGRQKNGT